MAQSEYSREVWRAAWLERLGEPLVCGEVQSEGGLGRGQVVVRVAFSGVCHSQLMEARGRRGDDPYLPHLLGHEATGVVEAIGEEVSKVTAGDRVILTWIRGTGCDVGGGKVNSNGQRINAGPVATFGERAIVSENRVVPLPEAVPMDVGVLFGCALPTGLGMVMNELQPQPGNSAVVIGLGGVGLCALMGVVAAGCEPVIAVDVSEDKRRLAKTIGATEALDPRVLDVVDTVTALTGGGTDFGIEAAGRVETIEMAFGCIRKDGGRCIFASHPPHGERIRLDPHDLISGKSIQGSWGGACQSDWDFPRFAELYQQGKLPLELLVENRYRLEEVNSALNDLEAGRAFRPLLEMTGEG